VPILDADHDFAHPVEGDTAWSESYYFNAYCPVVDAGFFTRIGVRPNEQTMDVGLSVWLPNGELAHFGAAREQSEMTDADLEVSNDDGRVRYDRVAPMQTWRLTAETKPFALDVTFEALTPAIGIDGQGRRGSGASAATGASVGKGHLEQAGRWSGWIQHAGTRYELVDARGNRDKSWGPRRWSGPRMWRWFSVNIGDDVHFGGIRIGTDAGDLHRGWVWKDGEHASIREWDVKSELADDGVTHRVSHVRATDKHDRVHELRADLLRVAPGAAGIRPNTTIVNEGLARWTYEGRSGYGISEYLHQLDEDARPVVPIE
jgi:hypothetical protein